MAPLQHSDESAGRRLEVVHMEATVVELASSHVPMLSNPAAVVEVIRKTACAVQEA